MGKLRRFFARFLLKTLYRRLWLKTAVVMIVIITIPVVFLGFFLVENSQKTVRDSLLNSQREMVNRATGEISLWLKRVEDILSSTAEILGSMNLTPWQQETVLVGLALNQPLFMRISSIDLSGKAIASSDLGGTEWYFDPQATQKIMEKRIYISPVQFQKHPTPYVTVAVPVLTRKKLSGALLADVDLRSLWEIVDDIRKEKTGRAFLVSSEGSVLSHPDKKLVLRNEYLGGEGDVQLALAGKSGTREMRGEDGQEWLSSYAPVAQTGWVLIFRQNLREAYLVARVAGTQAWLIVILAEIVAIFVAVFIARRFSRPIQALCQEARGISEGRAGHPIRTKRRDEIGELISVFNDLAEKLKKARRNEKFSTVSEAASWVAHELKNSLAPVKSFLQLLPSRRSDDEFMEKFADIVPEEINRCERMLKEFSEFSRSQQLRKEEVGIEEAIREVLSMMSEEMKARGINVSFDKGPGLPRIYADPEKVRQIFINLVLNAIVAMPQGGTLGISLRAMRFFDGGSMNVQVRVSDTGTGISEERLKNIFTPFSSTKRDGMGLGLAISRKIAQQHSGDVSVESRLGEGTTFTVTLPAEASLREPII